MKSKKYFVLGLGLIWVAHTPQGASARPKGSETHTRPVAVAPVENTGGSSGEDWKGSPEGNRFEVGGLTGMGIIDSRPGWSILFTGAVNILEHGFIPDVNDTAFIEVQGGPMLRFGTTPFQYSTHLRWDFRKDESWIVYALGGVGGHVAGDGVGGTRFLIFPRIGVGAMLNIGKVFNLRAELSHELIAAGITLPLF